MSGQLTPEFLTGDFKTLLYEFTAINKQNNPSIPIFGIYVYNIANALKNICNDIQKQYSIVIYNPLLKVDAYFENNSLYVANNKISFQSLDQLNSLLNLLTNAVNYINMSSYNNYLVNTLPSYVNRLQYAINFVTRYTNSGLIACDHTRTFAQYGFNSLKIYCG